MRRAGRTRIRTRRALLAAVTVLVLVGGGAAAVAAIMDAHSATVSIRAALLGDGKSKFHGTFDGKAVRAVSSPADKRVTKRLCPTTSKFALGVTFTGTFAGKPFVLHACDSVFTAFQFRASGHAGSSRITGSATLQLSSACSAKRCYGSAPFTGRIGSHLFTGTAHVAFTKESRDLSITANMRIS